MRPGLLQLQPQNDVEVKFLGDLGFFACSVPQQQLFGHQIKVLGIRPDAVTAAASGGHLEIVRLLVNAGAPVDGVKKTILNLSKDWGMRETVRNLYPAPLHAAITGGHVQVAQPLLAQGEKAEHKRATFH